MLGDKIKELRKEKLLSSKDLAETVGVSPSTISRYENNRIERYDLDLIEKIAGTLDSSTAYLLGATGESYYNSDIEMSKYYPKNYLKNIIVTDDDLEPEISKNACIQIRNLQKDEELVVGHYYYIEFDDKKVFRLVVDDYKNGIGFIPMDMSERRIAFDKDYVKVIGKAVLMITPMEENN